MAIWPRLLLTVIFAIIILLYVWLDIFYRFPESTPLLSFDAATTTSVRLRYPEFASVGDASYIEMTVINTGTSPISGTLVIVLDSEYPVSLLPDNRADLALVNLPPGNQISHRLEFRPVGSWDPPVVGSLPFHLLLLSPDGQTHLSGKQKIDLMPIPHLSRVLAGLGAGFLAGLAALFWERIKKWLFP